MSNDPLAGLFEDVFGHGMAKDTAEINFVQATHSGDLRKRRFLINGKSGRNVQTADCLHAKQFIVLGKTFSAFVACEISSTISH